MDAINSDMVNRDAIAKWLSEKSEERYGKNEQRRKSYASESLSPIKEEEQNPSAEEEWVMETPKWSKSASFEDKSNPFRDGEEKDESDVSLRPETPSEMMLLDGTPVEKKAPDMDNSRYARMGSHIMQLNNTVIHLIGDLEKLQKQHRATNKILANCQANLTATQKTLGVTQKNLVGLSKELVETKLENERNKADIRGLQKKTEELKKEGMSTDSILIRCRERLAKQQMALEENGIIEKKNKKKCFSRSASVKRDTTEDEGNNMCYSQPESGNKRVQEETSSGVRKVRRLYEGYVGTENDQLPPGEEEDDRPHNCTVSQLREHYQAGFIDKRAEDLNQMADEHNLYVAECLVDDDNDYYGANNWHDDNDWYDANNWRE